jgi:sorting and assembly machinery component 37
MFYSLEENWWKLTHPTLTSMLSLPQRLYVPGRLRDSFRPRLEAEGLWSTPGPVKEEDKNLLRGVKKEDNDKKNAYARIFEREKVRQLEHVKELWCS